MSEYNVKGSLGPFVAPRGLLLGALNGSLGASQGLQEPLIAPNALKEFGGGTRSMETGFWNQSLGLGRVTSTARGKKNIGPVLMAVRSR